jgi:ubiquinone/menaquinone biosynthesis C-methylase UbiE
MADEAESVQRNKSVFEREREHYLERALFPAEFELLRLYRDRWRETDLLDLGVGAGRTALTFSILARRYVGIDYAPGMVELCKQRIPESDSVRFVVADATDLSLFYDAPFDVVLFSFNGLDCVSHEQRLQVLGEVHKVLEPDGHFFFSSHSLHVVPFRLKMPRRGRVSLVRWLYRCAWKLSWFVKQKYHNRGVRIEEAKRRGWVILADGEHNFEGRFYYVDPKFQVEQLAAAGFEVVTVYDQNGKPVDWRTPTDDTWLHYLCRPINR